MEKKYTLVITEKPSSAMKVAAALADSGMKKEAFKKVPYYSLSHGGAPVVVVPAAGHLFGLIPKGTGYPILQAEWAPSYEGNKAAAFTKAYVEAIASLAKKAGGFVSATDFDIEGEVIAANILEFACKHPSAKRMKFSTLTKDELVAAFENAVPRLNANLIAAGRTRHQLDFFWGISLSRALMAAIKAAGRFQILSIGRVQGPALAIIARREKEIAAFVPTPYWEVSARIKEVEFFHEHGRFLAEGEANAAVRNSGKSGTVSSVARAKYHQLPPVPFDLTTLQTEAFRAFGFSPTMTLDLAQNLYEQALISYPRTASQKLSEKLGLPGIIKKIAEQPAYAPLARQLIAGKRFTPHEGKLEDPAHPAIYPTGDVPHALSPQQQKVYDIVVKRFLACFAPAAVRERLTVKVLLGSEPFSASGARTLEPHWFAFYAPYVKLEEVLMPPFAEGEKIVADAVENTAKVTQPPKRFTQASIVRKLEEEELGTKCIAGFEELSILNDSHKVTAPIETIAKRIQDAERTCHAYTADGNSVVTKKITGVCSRPLEHGEKMLTVETDHFSLCTTDLHDYFVYEDGAIKTKKANQLKKGDFIVTKKTVEHSPKSRLFANLVGDCSLHLRKDVKGGADIRYHNKDPALIEEFARNISDAYGTTVKSSDGGRGRLYVRLPLPLGSRIFKENPEIKNKTVGLEAIDSPASFAAALIDDEGCIFRIPAGELKIKGIKTVSHGIPKIKVTMKTVETLKILQYCLDKIGIASTIIATPTTYGGKPYSCFTLWIRGRRNMERCAARLPLRSTKKMSRLIAGLAQYSVVKRKEQTLARLGGDWKRLSEFTELGTLPNRTRIAKELAEDGIIELRKRTIRSKAGNTNTTVFEVRLACSFSDTIYSHLKDTVISFDLFAKKITRISGASYQGPVFDLTISPETPCYFVGRGSFLVHNSTRAGIVQTLFDRGYAQGKSIGATPLGLTVFEALEKNAPHILEEKLTRHFEEEIESISGGSKPADAVVEEARGTLTTLLGEFRARELDIGKTLLASLNATQKQQSVLGPCLTCGKGQLVMRSSRFGLFVGCNAYPACKQTYPLPKNALVKPLGSACKTCGAPLVMVIRKGKRPFSMCVKPDCESKKSWGGKQPVEASETGDENASAGKPE